MGVPKFFRYISERYPCLSEIIKEYQIPEFDNLYLDMNGIIHMCSHPDDGDPHFRITEETIFKDIFHYIEVLFRMIKPRKVFFMAVDGVAPRAKMNQQRGRRFRSAKEAQTLEAKARERGEVLPTEARFDSNCITPGTVFMARLHEQLKYFVVNKVSTDKLWQQCKIVLSGQETPGEGEHKIMDYIRYMRAQPGYDPNTRHCLYGLDADLIMLGLCTHEPHFSLLREEVRFGKKSTKRKSIPEQITFYLLHLSLMREYLELEFYSLRDSLSFEYEMEKVIDDWVLMGFLVGNDFIPHLPNMHIGNGALPILYNTYMKVLPKLGGYINEAGTLNLERFEMFMQELANIDIENFSEKYADLKWFEGKTGRRPNEKNRPPTLRKLEPWAEGEDLLCEPLESLELSNVDLAALIKATEDFMLEPSDLSLDQEEKGEITETAEEPESDTSEKEGDLFNAEFVQHKTDYYMNKLEYERVTPEVLRSQAEEYVRAIQWNLHYYYNGVCSWSWFYPHHYAPYISDIKGFSNLTFNFELGDPFKPYEQLLAVLPAASKILLPLPYQELMTNEDSPIKEYYPEDFKTDLNGKKQEWEAVVLIPFIAEDVLLKAMETCSSRLTSEEVLRNSHGPMLVYVHTKQDLGEYLAPEYFPPVKASHAECERLSIQDIRVPRDKLVKGAYPGVNFDVYYPGFPTMKHLTYQGSLDKCKVKVFEQPSRGENMILRIMEDSGNRPTANAIAIELLGKTVHVGWPHLIEALVVSVSDAQHRYHSVGAKGQYNVEENKGNLGSQWTGERQGITEHYRNRLGVDVGITNILVHVKVMIGRKYVFSSQGRITLDKQWAHLTCPYPLQTVVRNISVYEEKYVAYKDIGSVFPVGSNCFMLGHPCYGSMGQILDSRESLKEGRIKLSLKRFEEPDLSAVKQFDSDVRVRFMNLHVASTKLSISKSLFSRITGCVYITPGANQHNIPSEDIPKVNIGLNLKFNKRNEEVPGYTRKEGNTWLYSEKAVRLARDYIERFPKVFDYLTTNMGNDVFFEEEMFPDGNAKEHLREITAWMKQQPFFSVERQVCGSCVLDPESIQMLEGVVDEFNTNNTNMKKHIVLQVRPHLLFKPELQMGNLMPDSAANFRLYDRIVNVREGYSVPLGLKGTITGMHKSTNANESETTYDVLFDQAFAGGLSINCSPNRAYRMPRPAVINISYGQRVFEQKTGKPGQLLQQAQHNAQSQKKNNNVPLNPVPPSQLQPAVATQAAPLSSTIASSYPQAHFQSPPMPPPAFQSWSKGCGFPQAPVPAFNYNYMPPDFGSPNFVGNPFAHPVYSPNYVNSTPPLPAGPNTFVPYKSNHFPNNVPPNYMQPAPVQNLGSPQASQLTVANGRDTNEPKKDREKRERNGSDGGPTKSVSHVGPSDNRPEVSQDQFQKLLKNMLKINEGPGKPSGKRAAAKQKDQTAVVPQAVNDFFAAHAKANKQQKSPKAVAREPPNPAPKVPHHTSLLQSEYQSRGLGSPNYQYFEANKKFTAKVTLPNGKTIFGAPANTQDQASENAAAETLPHLLQLDGEPQPTKPPSEAVPEPPKKWQGATAKTQHPNSAAAAKNWPTAKGKGKVGTQEAKKGETRDREERRGAAVHAQILRHLNIDPATAQHQQQQQPQNTSQFVPMQVTKHRSRTNSSGTSGTVADKEKATSPKKKSPKKERVPVPSATSTTSPQKGETAVPAPPALPAVTSEVQPGESVKKRRKERKTRIAANFQTTMV